MVIYEKLGGDNSNRRFSNSYNMLYSFLSGKDGKFFPFCKQTTLFLGFLWKFLATVASKKSYKTNHVYIKGLICCFSFFGFFWPIWI